jgi:type I restriction enzyme S subunit
MSRIDQLIEQLCPLGVEWKRLGEVCEFKNGFAFKSGLFKENGLPIIRITNVDGRNIDLTDVKYFDPVDYRENIKSYEVINGDILIAMSGATTGKIGYYSHSTSAYLNQRVGKFLPKEEILNNRFLYHFLLSKVVEIYVFAGGAAQPNLSSNMLMEKLEIPVPPLEVQEEIVITLDLFTTLEAELEAELEARKMQYTHYRDSLLGFEGKEVEWKTLGELGEFIRGNGLQKKDFTESGVGCIHYGQIYTHYGSSATKTKTFVSPELAKKLKKARKNDLIIAGVSENVEDVCKAVVWLGDEDICISGDAFIFRHKQNPKYIGYLFQAKSFLEFKKKYAQGAKVTRLQSGRLPKYTVPIPSLTEQERIASVLEKFDALVNDISNGLPAEIEGRRKQYVYYRNRLLTFKPLQP